ncbi:hypothetical protein Tco_0996189 [Tanacetum coccineum]
MENMEWSIELCENTKRTNTLSMCGEGIYTYMRWTWALVTWAFHGPWTSYLWSENTKPRVKSAMQVNFPISPMTRVWSAERGLLKSAMRDSASGRLLSKIKESPVTRSDLHSFFSLVEANVDSDIKLKVEKKMSKLRKDINHFMV